MKRRVLDEKDDFGFPSKEPEKATDDQGRRASSVRTPCDT